MIKFIPKLHCIKGFLLLSCIVLFSTPIFTQTLQQAPVNPEFVKYQNGLGLKQSKVADGHGLGLIPEPVLPNFAQIPSSGKRTAAFASKYDLRTAGVGGTSLVTSVKDQGGCGACWTFGSMGVIEGLAKKTGKGDFDLSENNMKECHGFLLSACDGGNSSMSSAYLARKSGPVSEQNDPYNEKVIGCRSDMYPEFWVSDIRYLPNDPNIIKQSLLDYGVLSTSFFWADANYNAITHTYFSTGATTTNHAVVLVGWDDDKVTAGGTGAWIIKNSWGPSWGENGYFYISYNDSKINSSVTSIRGIENRVTNSTLFDYDQLGVMNSYGYGSNTAYALIRFSPGNKNYTLKKLSTFIQSGPATVRFDVFANFNGTTLSNSLGTIYDKTCDLPGYYTFDLTSPILIPAYNDFYIRVTYTTTGFNYPIPVEAASAGYANPVIESGKCWISSSGNIWTAIGADQSVKGDLCIKAYGESSPCTPPTSQASGFSASSIGNNTMTVNWTRGNGNGVLVVARAGSPVNFDPFGESVFTANAAFGNGTQLGTGNFVVYNGTGTTANISGLNPGTIYYYSVYEYNSATGCYLTPGLTGNATTAGLAPYCTAGAIATTIGWISRVRLNTIDQTSSLGANGYEDYTSQMATMQVGVNSTITINRSNAFIKDSVLIWVDWNKDGDFSDPGENVYSSTTSGLSYTASFAPPAGAAIGTTRMRIRLLNTNTSPNSTPCGNSYYGDVQDYSIYVAASLNIPPPPFANTATNIQQTGFNANWSSSSTATGYKLDVATDYAFTSFVPGYNNKDVGNVTWTGLTGLSINSIYYYRVKAYNLSGESIISNIISVNTLPVPPSAPTAIGATNIQQTTLTAKWNSANSATGYLLDVSTNNSFTAMVTGFNSKDVGNVPLFTVTGLSARTPYYFRVKAYNLGGSSSSSNIITVNTLTNPPSAPIDLKSSSCNDIMTLSWRNGSGTDVTSYRIFGGPSGGQAIKIDSTTSSINDVSKNISGLKRGQTYFFYITAVNFDGPESIFSSMISETIKKGVVPFIKAKWGDVLICANLGDSIKGFQWFKSGVAISNATAQSYVTNKLPGIYTVESTDLNGCKNLSNALTITGTKSLSAFPNPTSENFSLKISDVTEGRANVTIINSSGITVKEFQTDDLNDKKMKEVSVRNLTPGIYIVKVLLDNKELYYTKIVVTQ